MEKIRVLADRLLEEEAGMESVELAMVGALIIIASIGVWQLLGTSIQKVLTDLVSYLS